MSEVRIGSQRLRREKERYLLHLKRRYLTIKHNMNKYFKYALIGVDLSYLACAHIIHIY